MYNLLKNYNRIFLFDDLDLNLSDNWIWATDRQGLATSFLFIAKRRPLVPRGVASQPLYIKE